jgi:hypothetical protein
MLRAQLLKLMHHSIQWAAQSFAEPMPESRPQSSTAASAGRTAANKSRDECLSLEWFRSRTKVTVVIEHSPKSKRATVASATEPGP